VKSSPGVAEASPGVPGHGDWAPYLRALRFFGGKGVGQVVAKEGRDQIEVQVRSFMMPTMVTNLKLAQSAEDGNRAETAVEQIVLDVGEPVSDLEDRVMQGGSAEKGDERPRRQNGAQNQVVKGKGGGEEVPACGQILEVLFFSRAETVAMESPMMLNVRAFQGAEKAQASMHEEAVVGVFHQLDVGHSEHEGQDSHARDLAPRKRPVEVDGQEKRQKRSKLHDRELPV
jgi:hypothetical protein